MSQHTPIYGAVAQAKQALKNGDAQGALVHLQSADAVAGSVIEQTRRQVEQARHAAASAGKRGGAAIAAKANRAAQEANSLITYRQKIRGVLKTAGLGGVPAGAGLLARVPFYQLAVSGDVEAGSEWCSLPTAAATTVTGETPDIPYLKYRVHGFVANAPLIGSDIVIAEDLKAKGYPNMFLGEGPIPIAAYDGMAPTLGGLRAKADVKSPNVSQVTLRSFSYDTSAAEAVASAEISVESSLCVEILHDDVHGDMNSFSARRRGGSLLTSMAVPGTGYVERIPLLVKTATNFQAVDSVQAQLGFDDTTGNDAVTTVTLQSEEIPYQDAQVVGLEVDYIENADATYPSIVLLEDYKVKGGATLFPQEGATPAWNYLGDAANYNAHNTANAIGFRSAGGWGVHKRPALRHYPKLDPTNRIELTVSVKNKDDSDGAMGLAATSGDMFTYVQAWALVNRLSDEIYGGPGEAIAKAMEGL